MGDKRLLKTCSVNPGSGTWKLRGFSGPLLVWLLCGAAAWFFGCAHPYVASLNMAKTDPERSSAERDLLTEGVWRSARSGETWYVAESDDLEDYYGDEPALIIVLKDRKGHTGSLAAWPVEVGDRYFLFATTSALSSDLETPQSMVIMLPGLSEDLLTIQPVFTIYRIESDRGRVILSELRADWLRRSTRDGTEGLESFEGDDYLLITSSPEQIRSFLESRDDLGEAFRKYRVLEYRGPLVE